MTARKQPFVLSLGASVYGIASERLKCMLARLNKHAENNRGRTGGSASLSAHQVLSCRFDLGTSPFRFWATKKHTIYVDPSTLTMTAISISICYAEPYPALEEVQHSSIRKYVLITNASQDIGRSIALAWARAGAAGIAISSRNTEDIGSISTEIKVANPDVQTLGIACDTTSSSDVTRLFSAVRDIFERLDVVIANVGTMHLDSKNAADHNDMWWTDITTNFRSTHLSAHQYICAYGPSPTGTFISIPSGAGTIVSPGASYYLFAKQIDRRLIEFLAFEYPEIKAFSLHARQASTTSKLLEAVDPDLVGLFSVWLGGGRADALKGSCIDPSWDVKELEFGIEKVSDKKLSERDTSQWSVETRYAGIAKTIGTRTAESTRT